MSRESKIMIGVLVVVVGGMIALFALAGRNGSSSSATGAAPDPAALVRSDSNKTGTGALQVVEFGDFQCPACGNAHPGLKQLAEEYKDKITFVFRNYPLVQIHKNATAAANAAEEAKAQGKYWEMHNKLYETQTEWENLGSAAAADKFAGYANDLGMDGDKVKSAVLDQKYKSKIDADVADGNKENVQATPTVFIGGKQYTGSYSYAELKKATDSAIAEAAKQ